jgi:hypothetical protein
MYRCRADSEASARSRAQGAQGRQHHHGQAEDVAADERQPPTGQGQPGEIVPGEEAPGGQGDQLACPGRGVRQPGAFASPGLRIGQA